MTQRKVLSALAGAIALATACVAGVTAAKAEPYSVRQAERFNHLEYLYKKSRSGEGRRELRGGEGRELRKLRREFRHKRFKSRGGVRHVERRHNRKHRNNRYRARQRGYNHYYNGFWYATPFWLYGNDYYEPSYSYGGSDWELHVDWCHNRYRSYNENRDAFKGYDGRWHKCKSPYA